MRQAAVTRQRQLVPGDLATSAEIQWLYYLAPNGCSKTYLNLNLNLKGGVRWASMVFAGRAVQAPLCPLVSCPSPFQLRL
jgi:hypothetical protein